MSSLSSEIKTLCDKVKPVCLFKLKGRLDVIYMAYFVETPSTRFIECTISFPNELLAVVRSLEKDSLSFHNKVTCDLGTILHYAIMDEVIDEGNLETLKQLERELGCYYTIPGI